MLKDMFLKTSFDKEGGYMMGIGSVTSMNSMSGMQMAKTGSTDSKSKNIQNEITDIQQQMQKLSSKEELSVNEKTAERKKLQREISNLNTELKQHQEELSKSQKREIMMAELQEDSKTEKEEKPEDKMQTKESSPDKTDGVKGNGQESHQGTVIAKNTDGIVILKEDINRDEKPGASTEKKQTEETDGTKEEDIAGNDTKPINSDMDTGLSRKKMHDIVSADSSLQQAGLQGTVITRIRGGIVILRGEMKQDERLGTDTEKKQDELEKLEKKEQRAMAFQFSVLGEANDTMKPAAKTNVSGTQNRTQESTENIAFTNAFKSSGEESRASQQRFYISLGN